MRWNELSQQGHRILFSFVGEGSDLLGDIAGGCAIQCLIYINFEDEDDLGKSDVPLTLTISSMRKNQDGLLMCITVPEENEHEGFLQGEYEILWKDDEVTQTPFEMLSDKEVRLVS